LFANRYTAFVDACVLAGNLRRDLLLTLAEAEFFRIRWSSAVLNEMQSAVEQILGKDEDAAKRAGRVRALMEASFSDARVDDFDSLLTTACGALPDKDDAHVVAAALKTRADVIVTDNLKDFPEKVLAQLGLDVRSADAFIADTIMLDTGRAVDAIRDMRSRFKKPSLTAEALLLKMEAHSLADTADALRPFLGSL
jgi:predicted nucleic acid-binding protein